VKQLPDSARTWQVKNRPDMARGIVEKILLIDPSQPDALGLLGQTTAARDVAAVRRSGWALGRD